MLTISPEDAEELAFVPHLSEKEVRYWQFASVVAEEGGDARTLVSAVL